MRESPVVCGRCKSPLRNHALNSDTETVCPQCYTKSVAYVYPSWYKENTNTAIKELAEEGNSTCFFHDKNKATALCDSCGRLICETCSLEYGGKTHCSNCVGEGKALGVDLRREARRYDQLALLLSLAPLTLIFWFIGFFSAPFALFLVFRHWNTRETIVPFNRWRFVAAGLLALAQIGGSVFMIIQIIKEAGNG